MKTKNITTKNTNSKGFTLVELMVVVAIIAVLAVVGLTLFANSQQGARNAKRRSDLLAMANAMETHYQPVTAACVGSNPVVTANGSTYCPLQNSYFAGNLKPTDPTTGGLYCVASSTTANAATPVDMASAANGGCTAGTANYAAVTNQTVPPVSSTTWKICANLEPWVTGTSVFCVSNQQQ